MSKKDALSSSLDNNAVHDEDSLSNSISFNGPKENILKDLHLKARDDDDSDNDYDEDLLTQSYGEISLEQELLRSDFHSTQEGRNNGLLRNGEEAKASPGNRDDSEEDVMTGSYGEISLERELNCDKTSDSQGSSKVEENLSDENRGECSNEGIQKKRPDSLILAQTNLSPKGELFPSTQMDRSQQTSEGRAASADFSASLSSEEFAVRSSGHNRTGSDTSGLSELQGTLVVDGDMVTFVAEDLQEKIKMSSPVSRWADASFPGSRSSTPSLYRQALQPSHHIIDPNILTDLENHAKKVATCVDTMLENLSGTLQSISSLTVDCMETYESSVCKTCDAVDMNIKAVYQLMAKSEELSNSMGPLYKVAGDVKHIKKMLDQLEHIAEHKS